MLSVQYKLPIPPGSSLSQHTCAHHIIDLGTWLELHVLTSLSFAALQGETLVIFLKIKKKKKTTHSRPLVSRAPTEDQAPQLPSTSAVYKNRFNLMLTTQYHA